MSTPHEQIKGLIRTIPDFPEPGILFRDITTLLSDPEGLSTTLDLLEEAAADTQPDVVAAFESRGFILGGALAVRLGVGFVPLRKPGKLPGETHSVQYQLEYGIDELAVHVGAIKEGDRVLFHDDLIATGGTAEAGLRLVNLARGESVGLSAVVDLPDLGGSERIRRLGVPVHTLVEFAGH